MNSRLYEQFSKKLFKSAIERFKELGCDFLTTPKLHLSKCVSKSRDKVTINRKYPNFIFYDAKKRGSFFQIRPSASHQNHLHARAMKFLRLAF